MAGAADQGLQVALAALIASGSEVRAYLMETAHVPNLATMRDVADISADSADFVALANVTTTDGVLDADDISFEAVAAGDEVDSIWIAVWDTDEASSPLVFYVDSFASGMPITPNGGDIDITWNASGIGKL